MSKRRKPGEIVQRSPGSGFVADADPQFVQIPFEPEYTTEAGWCMVCEEKGCREWANLKIVGGKWDGHFICHISECELSDAPPGVEKD